MADRYVSQVQLPNNETYNIRDKELIPRLKATVGHSNKNLLNLKNIKGKTEYGITWIIDEQEGIVTATGTVQTGKTAQLSFVFENIPSGNYYFYGCIGGSDATYDVYCWDYTTSSRPKQWDGTTNVYSDYNLVPCQLKIVDNHEIGITLRIKPGVTVDNLIFKPMVWDGSISDDTFEPYEEPTDLRAIKVKTETNSPTTATDYYPTLCTSSTTGTLTYNAHFKETILTGTASDVGYSVLNLGNSTATGTAGNAYGMLRLYAEKSGYGNLKYSPSATGNSTHILPSTGGTLWNSGANYYLLSNSTDATWANVGIDTSNLSETSFKMIRWGNGSEATVPNYTPGKYTVGISIAAGDKGGFLGIGNSTTNAIVSFGGGTRDSTTLSPQWYWKIQGTNEKIYNLNNNIINITRNNTTFTATKADGDTFTFTQQDKYVNQENSITTDWRHIILGYASWSTTDPATTFVNQVVYKNNNIKISPGYGRLFLKGSSPQQYMVSTTFDLTASDNGVSSETWRALRFLDKNENNISLFISSVTNSKTMTLLRTYNKNTGGTESYDAYLGVSVSNTGVTSYQISDPAAFRTAIGVTTTSVSFSRSLSSGTKIGSIEINGTSTDIYSPTIPTALKNPKALTIDSKTYDGSSALTVGQTVHYIAGSGGTAANTTSGSYYAAKWVGADTSITSLYTGLTVAFKVEVAGHGTYGTVLNLNNLGEHPVVVNVNTMVSTRYPVGSIVILVYDASQKANVYINNVSTSITGCWKVSDYDSINIYQLKHNNGNYTTKTALYRYMLCLSNTETTLLPINTVNNSIATNKTLTTTEFNPFGAILYYNSTTTVNANAAIGANTLYEQVNIDLRYSFNTGTTLTNGKDVYIVATPQSNGKAKLHSSPITQTLPTSDNGLIYIYLGHASSTSAVEIHPVHPVFWYKNGQLCLYTGSSIVTQTLRTTDNNYPILLSMYENTNTTAGVTNGVYRNNSVYVNTSVGSLHSNEVCTTKYRVSQYPNAVAMQVLAAGESALVEDEALHIGVTGLPTILRGSVSLVDGDLFFNMKPTGVSEQGEVIYGDESQGLIFKGYRGLYYDESVTPAIIVGNSALPLNLQADTIYTASNLNFALLSEESIPQTRGVQLAGYTAMRMYNGAINIGHPEFPTDLFGTEVVISPETTVNNKFTARGNVVIGGTALDATMLTFYGITHNSNTYADNNPKIRFRNSTGDQNVSLTFTDFNNPGGNASITLNGNQGGEYFIAPYLKATSGIINPSDRRLKENIQSLDSRYLDLIKNLNPVSFNFKEETQNNKTHMGFIAQDVEKVIEKVGLNNEDIAAIIKPQTKEGYYELSYIEFIPALLLYIKDLEKQIKEIKEKEKY